jgi:hypothetical protein
MDSEEHWEGTTDEPPSDEMDDGVTARQLLHAATGDREAEAQALKDRAGDDVGVDAARRAVQRAHGDRSDGDKPESDVASPHDARSAEG